MNGLDAMKQTRFRFKYWCIIISMIIASVSPFALDTFADLTSRMRNAIFKAYMNGYVSALKLDIERIEAMKTDKKLMKTIVMEAAREYVKRVEDMN